MRKLSIQGRHDQGASAVEFAIVSIVLVLLLTGILQFGYTFFQYLEVVHAAREGARWASLGVEPGSVGDSESVRGRV
ncbi:MAG: pilus assembly protein, partial [Actinomycetota bacterium]|nr:pilus assembly protein [Actinomycetota bacterium]